MRHIEDTLQASCYKWFSLSFSNLCGYLFHIPNGGNRNLLEAKRFKRMGVVSGVADLFLDIPSGGYHGLRLEMKTDKGKQSENQKEWQEKAVKAGYRYIVCRSLEDFQKAIVEYLLSNETEAKEEADFIQSARQQAGRVKLMIASEQRVQTNAQKLLQMALNKKNNTTNKKTKTSKNR